MKKWTKWLIAAVIVIAIVVCAILYVKNVGIGATLLNIIVGVAGIALGWLARREYDRFVDNCEELSIGSPTDLDDGEYEGNNDYKIIVKDGVVVDIVDMEE